MANLDAEPSSLPTLPPGLDDAPQPPPVIINAVAVEPDSIRWRTISQPTAQSQRDRQLDSIKVGIWLIVIMLGLLFGLLLLVCSGSPEFIIKLTPEP